MTMQPRPDETATDATEDTSPAGRLLAGPIAVVNIGLAGFAETLRANGVAVAHVDWQPPAAGDVVLANLLARLGS
jgi:hypothetical protein